MANKTETFDLNTAVSFLPVMDDTEEVTRQLISSIGMYDSLLDEASKPVLINFILTSRLSPGAKLRLTKNYKTVDHLVNDMNKYLLPKKSFTAIQQQLSQCTQNNKDIDSYAEEIEKLFVDLTIAQADGDEKKYRILRPINEKMAIRQFADGLMNRNLSTLIIARDYKSLKDAIQGAKDEQISMGTKDNNNHAPTNNYNMSGPARQGHSQGPQHDEHNSQSNQHDHPFLWKESGVKHFDTHNNPGIPVKIFDSRDGNQPRGGHSFRGHSRGGGHSVSHHYQRAVVKNPDNRDGNNQFRGRGQNSRGASHSSSNSGNHHNQGASVKNSDNRGGSHHSQRVHSQNSLGASNSGNRHNQGAPGKNSDNRDGGKQSQRGHGQPSRGNSRGANHSGNYQNQGTSNNNPGKSNSNNNQSKQGHNQSSRANSQGANQPGTYHNQGNRGKNSNTRGGSNNVGRPVVNVPVPEFMVDCQFRFTVVAGSSSVKPANNSKASGPNKNKQVAKK